MASGNKRLDELIQAYKAASLGRWVASGGTDFRANDNYLVGMTNPTGGSNGLHDRTFIAAIKNACDDGLLYEYAAQQEQITKLWGEIEALTAGDEKLRSQNAKMWGALEAQEDQHQRGLFNMTSEEIEHVHKLRASVLAQSEA